MSLSKTDLKKVYLVTYDARIKWRNILLVLDVTTATIDSIGKQWSNNPDECYREGLKEWLNEGEKSWEEMVEALSSPIVGHHDLARAIERDHLQSTAATYPTAIKSEVEQNCQKINEDLTIYLDKPLGKGAFGMVFKGICRDDPCAVKVLIYEGIEMLTSIPAGKSEEASKAFDRECEFLKLIQHPNVVQYLSTAKHPKSGGTLLVVELMDCNLRLYLSGLDDESLTIEIEDSISKDMACGLAYIHSKQIIHRDLCGDNILLNTTRPMPVAKISDFGMSRLYDPSTISHTLTAIGHRMGYLPIEAIRLGTDKYDSSLDVFSFGVIMVQIVCKLKTIKSVEDRSFHVAQIPHTHRLRKLIDSCLQEDMRKRPSAKDIYLSLTKDSNPVLSAHQIPKPNNKVGEQADSFEEVISKNRKSFLKTLLVDTTFTQRVASFPETLFATMKYDEIPVEVTGRDPPGAAKEVSGDWSSSLKVPPPMDTVNFHLHRCTLTSGCANFQPQPYFPPLYTALPTTIRWPPEAHRYYRPPVLFPDRAHDYYGDSWTSELLQKEADTNSVTRLLGDQLIQSSKIVEFGQALGVKYIELKELHRQAHSQSHPNPAYNFFRDVVERWRTRHPDKPTWEVIVHALKEIGEPKLVHNVEKYLRGSLKSRPLLVNPPPPMHRPSALGPRSALLFKDLLHSQHPYPEGSDSPPQFHANRQHSSSFQPFQTNTTSLISSLSSSGGENEYLAVLMQQRHIESPNHSWKVVFTVCMRTPCCVESLQELLKEQFGAQFEVASFCIKFKNAVILNIPYEYIKTQGYTVHTAISPCKIALNEVVPGSLEFRSKATPTYPPRHTLTVQPIAGKREELLVSLTLEGIETCSNQRQFCLKSPPLLVNPSRMATPPTYCPPARKPPSAPPFKDLLQKEADTNSVTRLLGDQLIQSSKIVEFGQALGVKYNELKELHRQAHSQSHPNPAYNFFCDVVERWRTQHSDKPTWEVIVHALKNIGESKLVCTVEKYLRDI